MSKSACPLQKRELPGQVRVYGNLIVPWVAPWSGEAKYDVRPCRYAGGLLAAWQPYAPGEGTPQFGWYHWVRQRKAVAELLCDICGEPTSEDDRWVFPIGDWMNEDGRLSLANTPAHKTCSLYSQHNCPVLAKRGLRPFQIRGTPGKKMHRITREGARAQLGVNIASDYLVMWASNTIAKTDVLEADEFERAYWNYLALLARLKREKGQGGVVKRERDPSRGSWVQRTGVPTDEVL